VRASLPQIIHKKTLESFAMAGAFDSLYPGLENGAARAQALADIAPVAEHAAEIKEEKENAVQSLFGDNLLDFTINAKFDLKKAPPLSKTEVLNNEKEVLGLYLSGHPLTKYARHLSKIVKKDISAIAENPTKGAVAVAGIVSRIKKRQTKNKDNWAQLTIEDEAESITANAFSKAWAAISGKTEINQVVIVKGDIRSDELSAKPEIVLSTVEPILNVIASCARQLIIHLPKEVNEEPLLKLNSLLDINKGITEVYFTVEEGNGQTCIKTAKKIVIHNALIHFIEEIFGSEAWDFN
jgi:DNA polymerase-3 subunit alpha